MGAIGVGAPRGPTTGKAATIAGRRGEQEGGVEARRKSEEGAGRRRKGRRRPLRIRTTTHTGFENYICIYV